MSILALSTQQPLRADLFFESPPAFIVPGRTPSAEASVISLRSNGLNITERFESLLNRGGAIALSTPASLFSWIPTQHLQMNLGLLNFLLAKAPWGTLNPELSNQLYLRYPLFQRLFQGLMPKLKLSTNSAEVPAANITQAAPVLNNPVTLNSPSISPANSDSNFLRSVQADLKQKIYTPEPEIQQKLSEINSKRMKEGKTPIDFQKTTQQIEAIMNNPRLSDKQKKSMVDDIRKKLGLGKGDMKKLFTKRLAKIYQQAADQIKNYLKNMENAVKEAEKIYGKNSPQAAAAKERLAAAKSNLEPTLQQYQHQASLYKSMYPSFWSKLGGFFKSIGKGLLKVGKVFTKIMNFAAPFLRFVPGIGQMVAFGWGALKGLVQAFKGNWKGLLGGVLNFAQGIPGIGTALSAVSSIASKVMPYAKGIYQAAQGNFSSLINWGIEGLQKIPGVAPFLSKTSDYLNRLISPFARIENPLQEGTPPGALNLWKVD